MGNKSRRKGINAEREVINALQPVVDEVYATLRQRYEWFRLDPPLLQRNTLQSDRGGHDITGLTWWSPEIKHHARIAPAMLTTWWAQCTRQAAVAKQFPVLFYRGDRTHWHVRMACTVFATYAEDGRPHLLPMVVDTSLAEWLDYFRARLYNHAATQEFTRTGGKTS